MDPAPSPSILEAATASLSAAAFLSDKHLCFAPGHYIVMVLFSGATGSAELSQNLRNFPMWVFKKNFKYSQSSHITNYFTNITLRVP